MNNNNNENNTNRNNANQSNQNTNQTNKEEKVNKNKENITKNKSSDTSKKQKDTKGKTDNKSADSNKSKSSKKQQSKSTEYKKKILKEANVDIEELAKALNVDLEGEEGVFDEATLTRVRIFLSQINEIRVQLARLDTNLAGTVYYDNEVFPVLNILFLLATSAGEYSLIARNLSQISFAKTSKIKDILDLTYDLDKLAEIVFDVVEYKTKKFLRIIGK